MPQPIAKIVQNPRVNLDSGALDNKPEMTKLVCRIFAVWAHIERQLIFLLIPVLGADAKAAVAIHSILTAQHLQLKALEAAAEAVLPPDDYDIFLAVMEIADAAQIPRNHLAHWTWCTCEQKPELLCLADPKKLKERDFETAKKVHAAKTLEETYGMVQARGNFSDVTGILAYSEADLRRALRDMAYADDAILHLTNRLDPKVFLSFAMTGGAEIFATTLDTVRDLALAVLSEIPPFREALDRRRKDRQNTQP